MPVAANVSIATLSPNTRPALNIKHRDHLIHRLSYIFIYIYIYINAITYINSLLRVMQSNLLKCKRKGGRTSPASLTPMAPSPRYPLPPPSQGNYPQCLFPPPSFPPQRVFNQSQRVSAAFLRGANHSTVMAARPIVFCGTALQQSLQIIVL